MSKARETQGISAIESSTSRSGITTFILKGKQSSIDSVKRELQKALSPKVSEVVLVPASTRGFIIGTNGRTLKAIQHNSSTNIRVGKKEDVIAGDEDSAEITIDGDIDGVAQAKKEILAIVAERTKTLTTRLTAAQVAPEFYVYITPELPAIESIGDVKISLPTDGTVSAIVISGERNAVQDAKTRIEQFVVNLQASCESVTLPLAKDRHRFVTAQDVFAATMCTVKADGISDSIIVFGPREKLPEAKAMILAMANSVTVERLDISMAHDHNVSHAVDLVRYLQASNGFAGIEKEQNVWITFPSAESLAKPANGVVLTIAGKSVETVKETRKEIVNLVDSIRPSRVAHISGIAPDLYQHIAGVDGKNVASAKEEFGIIAIIPDASTEGDDILLVYEGKPDEEFRPGEKVIQARLAKAVEFFKVVQAEQESLLTKVLTIPAKQHKYIIGPKRATITALEESGVSVQLGPGPSEATSEDSVIVRGPAEAVEAAAKSIAVAVAEGAEQETLSNYTSTFEFADKYRSQLIGKGGSNISRYREKLDVKIDLDTDGQITIKGLQSNVQEAQKEILKFEARLKDEVVYRLKVPGEYHRVLIGQKGSLVKRLEERYDVRILFPRTEDAVAQSSEGGAEAEYQPRSKDEIVVRGPSKDAGKARDEIMDLYKYEVEHAYSDIMTVPRKALARIIGPKGEYIHDISHQTGAKIEVSGGNGAAAATTAEISSNEGNTRTVKFSGTKEAIAKARARVEEIVAESEQFLSETVDVPKAYHRMLIGNKGATIREIVAQAGGPADAGTPGAPRVVNIPRQDSPDTGVVVQGNRSVVSRVVAEIKRRVEELERQVSIAVEVPLTQHKRLIGPGGAKKRELESKHAVQLSVPPQGAASTTITIVGSPEGVDAAKSEIAELTADKPQVEGKEKGRRLGRRKSPKEASPAASTVEGAAE
ncbi:uncharacterized protein V1518DRAFT_439491 [Limtongia smithiae]|uniref:uncharacterized protein n=1 Tax=Limtongia smithiae TaxID=1125753 RepID=UPI0034CF172A